MHIVDYIIEHFVKFATFAGGVASFLLWWRVGRGKDKVQRVKSRIAAENLLLEQMDRLVERVTVLRANNDKYIETISYLNRECPDCVPKLLAKLEQARNDK